MAIQIYRYRWRGVDIAAVNSILDPNLPASVVAVGPDPMIDVQADDSTKSDLDVAMEAQGWEFLLMNPSSPALGLVLRQEINQRLLVDSATIDQAFTTLLQTNITVAEAGILSIVGAITSDSQGAVGYARLALNGVQIVSSGKTGLSNVMLVGRAPVPPGVYVATLDWRVDLGGTQACNPASQPDAQFANLLVREMSG